MLLSEIRAVHVAGFKRATNSSFHLLATGLSGSGSNQVFSNPGLENLISELLATGFVFVSKASEGHSLRDAGWLRENATYANQLVAGFLTELAGGAALPDDVSKEIKKKLALSAAETPAYLAMSHEFEDRRHSDAARSILELNERIVDVGDIREFVQANAGLMEEEGTPADLKAAYQELKEFAEACA